MTQRPSWSTRLTGSPERLVHELVRLDSRPLGAARAGRDVVHQLSLQIGLHLLRAYRTARPSRKLLAYRLALRDLRRLELFFLPSGPLRSRRRRLLLDLQRLARGLETLLRLLESSGD
jgi:hypothetical protein